MRLPGLLCGALFTLACGVPAQSTTPETYSDYLKLNNQLICEARLRCCGTVCSDLTDSSYLKQISRTLDYLELGLVAFDSAAATTCLNSLAQRYARCNTSLMELPALTGCDKVLVSKAAIGSMCEARVPSCPQDSTCLGGRCTALVKLGQTCNAGIPCVPGAFCNTAMSPFVCAAYSQVGETCLGKQCDPTAALICLPSQLCGKPQPSGAPCTIASQCASGFCDSSLGSCQPQTVPQTLGEQLCAAAEPGMPIQ